MENIRPEIARFLRKFKKLVTPARRIEMRGSGAVRCRKDMCPIELVAWTKLRRRGMNAFDDEVRKACGLSNESADLVIDAADGWRSQFSHGHIRELRAIREYLLKAIGA